MKQILLYIAYLVSIFMWGRESYPLETRFRNPIDIDSFSKYPTMLLFVHSKCKNGYLCPTKKMQKALENDSLGFRKKYGIKLYVIYPNYSEKDIDEFDSFSPQNAELSFYTNIKYYGLFTESNTTPYIIFYDGKGHIRKKNGGSIEELNDSINTEWR